MFLNVGPGTPLDRLEDTLDSVQHWFGSDLELLLAVDDSGEPEIATALARRAPALQCVRTGRAGSGLNGGLFDVTCLALRTVLDRSRAPVVLQLDTDALVVGPGSHTEAAAHFATHPGVGMLGSYRWTCTGYRRDFSPATRAISRDLRPWNVKRHPELSLAMARTLRAARKEGYEDGEHVLGAAYFLSRECLQSLADGGWLTKKALRHSSMADDQLLSLVVRAAGWAIDDFARDGQPLAVVWRGLPWPVEEIVERGKAIIHSTKDHEELREVDVRQFFARRRRAATG